MKNGQAGVQTEFKTKYVSYKCWFNKPLAYLSCKHLWRKTNELILDKIAWWEHHCWTPADNLVVWGCVYPAGHACCCATLVPICLSGEPLKVICSSLPACVPCLPPMGMSCQTDGVFLILSSKASSLCVLQGQKESPSCFSYYLEKKGTRAYVAEQVYLNPS